MYAHGREADRGRLDTDTCEESTVPGEESGAVCFCDGSRVSGRRVSEALDRKKE